jgi:hypothetical protein
VTGRSPRRSARCSKPHWQAPEDAHYESELSSLLEEREVEVLRAELRRLQEYIHMVETMPALASAIRSLRLAGELPWLE